MYEYESFNEETKKFFQKAMDIYANIESLKKEKEVEKIGFDKHQCTFSRLDKKVFLHKSRKSRQFIFENVNFCIEQE